ncbi:MAG TPA: S8 family serine peptidase [Anaeromyxobacter sp.]|nr:S8 family serine peptidase [Anaeromyxobacter sp.]
MLVQFDRTPGPAERALVRGAGGDVRYTYRLVPAIAASLPEGALDALRRNPAVVRVEADGVVHASDAELDAAWGVKRVGAGTVHAGGNLGAGVRVGVLDSGVDAAHPGLSWDPACSANFVETETLQDGYGHGTHVAGTIAALDDGAGVVGMAPAATLCVYKVLSSSGSGYYSDVIAALERAVADGVRVTNSSFGSSMDPGLTVRTAFDNAAAAGVLNVASAGNLGTADGAGDTCTYPARFDSVVAVAATTATDARAGFSSTCADVELAAPGDAVYSTLPGGGHGLSSGTSMAAPHVAGTAALVLAANPGWSGDQVRAQLQLTALDLGDPGRDALFGFGLVDARAATGAANHAPVADDQVVAAAEDSPIAIALSASDPDGDALLFSVLAAPSHGVLGGTPPSLTYTPDPDFNGSDRFTFTANDGALDGNVATVLVTVAAVNDAPVASGQSVTADEGTPLAIALAASDADGDALTFAIVAGPSQGVLGGAAPQPTYTSAAGFCGTDAFSFAASDGQASSAPATVSVRVLDRVGMVAATYAAKKATVSVEATSSSSRLQSLTARAYDAAGKDLGGAALVFSSRKGTYAGTIAGVASKPFLVVVTSSCGGTATAQGAAIGG